MPNDEIAARRGPSSAGHGVSSVGTNSRVGFGSIAGFHCAKWRFGGIWARCTDSAALMKPAMPAAASRWPKLDFTAPSAQGFVAAAVPVGQRFELDRVTQGGAGAVRLDEVHRARGDVGAAQRAGDDVLLRNGVGRGQAVGAAVLVDRRTPHHRQHPVAVADPRR